MILEGFSEPAKSHKQCEALYYVYARWEGSFEGGPGAVFVVLIFNAAIKSIDKLERG